MNFQMSFFIVSLVTVDNQKLKYVQSLQFQSSIHFQERLDMKSYGKN